MDQSAFPSLSVSLSFLPLFYFLFHWRAQTVKVIAVNYDCPLTLWALSPSCPRCGLSHQCSLTRNTIPPYLIFWTCGLLFLWFDIWRMSAYILPYVCERIPETRMRESYPHSHNIVPHTQWSLMLLVAFKCPDQNVVCLFERPPLWSSGQSSWLQIQRFGFDSRRYQVF
jgi:hypothetical protein